MSQKINTKGQKDCARNPGCLFGKERMNYQEFLKTKVEIAKETGFEVDPDKINKALKPHQRDSVIWALRGGRRALFEAFGLGKTSMELEFCKQVIDHEGGKALIVLPLGVKQEFTHDAVELLGYEAPDYVRTMEEVENAKTDIMVTNYERVRDGDIDPSYFVATSLDEASVLRSFGSKTYQEFLPLFKSVKYKLVATATPSPNKYKELIHYAGYLEVMDTGQALTRFFKRDSTKANKLTLYPAQEDEFWMWVSSWALFVTKPSDLSESYSDDGYVLPELQVNWHEIPIEYGKETDKDGQFVLFNEASVGLKEEAKIKRESCDRRVAKMVEIVNAAADDEHFLIWHDTNKERDAIKKALPESVYITGDMDYDLREKRVMDFSNGKIRIFSTKKEISGSGCNFQKFCHREIFVGIDYKFNDFIQAVHRCYRFLQTEQVVIDIIYMENERSVREELEEKWKRHNHMVARMIDIIKTYGLSNAKIANSLNRKMGVKSVKVEGKHYTAVNDDCVNETKKMEDNSVDLIHTSIPFGNHYEYSANYADFGHNENDDRFFEQMDYLTPELLRILKPGRVAAIHVKDRVLFGNATGTGMPTIEPFHADCIKHYMKHGFMYFGMITVVTDVVRENNQTYRLGWTEQCKDGSKMGVGCPEYILLFRKLPTDRSTAYADDPVVKTKEEYTRAQWQLDAHAYWRSSGDRLLSKDELFAITDHSLLQNVYRKYSRETVYNYDEHLALAKKLDEKGKLPAIYMVVAPGSWNLAEVWDDINRMRTLNLNQVNRKKEGHICLAEGSLILTKSGYKQIENLEIGDLVLTHKGNWKPVIGKACTGENPTVKTKAKGVANLITTPDHKLWTRRTDNYPSRPKDGMRQAEPTWVEAKDTKGCFVNLKLPEIEENNLSEREWWIVGRYLADGHVGAKGDYFISVGKGKIKEFEEKAKGFYGFHHDVTASQYRLLSSAMSDDLKMILKECGKGAKNKQVPVAGICMSKEKSEALLSGYLSGDGNVTGNATSATSVSRALLLGMAMVAQRARDVIPSIYAGRPARIGEIDGRKVNCSQEWVMSWRSPSHHSESEILDDGAWKKVKDVVESGTKTTWSIQVEDDASYTAEGCIVKNCPLQLDIVERIINRFSNEGDLVLDPFGGLMTVPMTAVKMKRRGYGIELNPDYFRDGVGYLEEAEQEVDTPTLFDFFGIEKE